MGNYKKDYSVEESKYRLKIKRVLRLLMIRFDCSAEIEHLEQLLLGEIKDFTSLLEENHYNIVHRKTLNIVERDKTKKDCETILNQIEERDKTNMQFVENAYKIMKCDRCKND